LHNLGLRKSLTKNVKKSCDLNQGESGVRFL